MVMVAHKCLKTRKYKIASNRFLFTVCLSLTFSSSQGVPIVLDEKPTSINVSIQRKVDAYFSNNGDAVKCYFDNIPFNASTNSFLEANLSVVNITTSKVTFLANPRCDENHCDPTLNLKCVYFERNPSISKSAMINITGITKVRNLTAYFNPNNSSIQIFWLRPLPLIWSSLKMIYQITLVNETGDVVFNMSIEATSYSLNNVTECLAIVSITAIQDGNTSTVTEEVIYPDGRCDDIPPVSPPPSIELTPSNSTSLVSSSNVSIMKISTTSNNVSTTIENSESLTITVSTLSNTIPPVSPSPTSNDSITVIPLPSKPTTDGPLENLILFVVISLIVICLIVIVICSICWILGRYCYKRRVQQQESGSSRNIILEHVFCLDQTNQDTSSSQNKSNREMLTKQDDEMTGEEDKRNTVEIICLAKSNRDTSPSSMETIQGQSIEESAL